MMFQLHSVSMIYNMAKLIYCLLSYCAPAFCLQRLRQKYNIINISISIKFFVFFLGPVMSSCPVLSVLSWRITL